PEEHCVLPLAVTQVSPSLDALAHETDALRMTDRGVVEAVAGELEPVIAELAQQVALEQTRALVGDPTPAEGRMYGKDLELRDAVHVARLAKAHRPRALAVKIEDQSAEPLGLAQRALDLVGDGVSVSGPAAAEERFDLAVLVELLQPVDVVGRGAPERDHRAGATASRSRNRARTARGERLPSATPTRISARPPN